MNIAKNTTNKNPKFLGYKLLVPSKLKLGEILNANEPKFPYRLDFFLYLVNLTIQIPAINSELCRPDGFVPFNAKKLQPFDHDNYHKYLKYLVEQNVFEVLNNGQYIPDEKSRCYRLAEKYLSDKLETIDITDVSILKHLHKKPKDDFKAKCKYHYLHKWFNDGIQVDFNGAMNHINNELQLAKNEDYYHAYCIAYSKMLKIHWLNEKRFWFSIDKFGKRLHTNFTNLNKDLKPFISYKGNPLVSEDVKTSQPFLSLKDVKKSILPQFPLSTPYIPTSNTFFLSNTIMLENTSQNNGYQSIMQYMEIVKSGKLYEYLEDYFRANLGDRYFTDDYFDYDTDGWVECEPTPRNRMKKAMFQIFFSKNDTHTQAKTLFTDLFPGVMKIFEEIKGNRHISLDRRHKELAKRLQRLESHIMLDLVAKEISRQRPSLPIFTIHDSIVTTVGNEGFVKEIMEKIIMQEIGFVPKLEPEYWCKDCKGLKQAA